MQEECRCFRTLVFTRFEVGGGWHTAVLIFLSPWTEE